MVYYRRFFPCDVVGTVPFVAPHSGMEGDPRYNTFLAQVGGPARADCRTRLENLQRQLLQRRDVLTPSLPHPDAGYTIVGGVDVALEVSVQDFSFGFWQYGDPDSPTLGCPSLPAGPLTDDELRGWLPTVVGGDDDSLRPYTSYYYQAATQLGDPAAMTQPFAGLIRYPGADASRNFVDDSLVVPPFDPQPMRDVQSWLATRGEAFVFVYGEFDPWTAGQFNLGQAIDAMKAIAPGNNHYSAIRDLTLGDNKLAVEKISRWLGESTRPGAMFRAPPRAPPPPHKGPPLPRSR